MAGKISVSTNPLMGVSSFFNAFQNGQNAQEDRQYMRQSRVQQLQSMQQSNEQQGLQTQQMQRQMADQDSIRQAARQGLQSSATTEAADSQSPFSPDQQAGQAQSPQAPVAQSKPVATPTNVGPMSLDQLAALDKQRGLPIGTSYGIMKAESNGDPNAVSPKGAQGLFQVMPTTAKDPGYGLQPFDPKDPNGAMDYFAALYKKSGGDLARATGFWNAGEKGNLDNPETRAFTPKVLQGVQDFQQMYGLRQQQAQAAPAEKVAAAQDAGATIPLTGLQAAASTQQKMVQTALTTARNLEAAGKPDLAQPFYAQAAQLQKGAMDLQSKNLTAQKEANNIKVEDQGSYNNLLSQIQQNPAMRDATRGLNLTGDFEQDQSKLATIRDRSLTLKDQMELKSKQAQVEIDRQKALDAHMKAQAPLVAQAQAQVADEKRMADAQQKGIPFVPSPSADGGDPKIIQARQKIIDTANAKILPTIDQHIQGARAINDITTQMGGLLNKPDPVKTSGMLGPSYSQNALTAMDQDRQMFDKLSGQLVSAMQSEAGAQGGSRSSFTAAMYQNYEKQKPTLNKADPVNRALVTGLWVGAQDSIQRGNFLRDFHAANPSADIQSGAAMWESYEQSLGPAMVLDPTQSFGFHPNMNRSPTLPDGKPNPQYKDWRDYFKNNYHG